MEKGSSPGDLASYGGPTASVQDQIQAAVAANPVTVFIKKNCPFCIEVHRTFDGLNVQYASFDVPAMANSGEVHAELKKLNDGYATFPYVYINKKFIGGCDATKQLQASGELQNMLLAAGVMAPRAAQPKQALSNGKSNGEAKAHAHAAHGPPEVPIKVTAGAAAVQVGRAPGTLFGFPNTIDDRAARFNGALSCIVCILVAVFFRSAAAHWSMVGLLADFTLRFFFGHSPIAALSQLGTAIMELFGSKPIWRPGPPKQFAALCGVMFSFMATFFFLTQEHEEKLEYVGLAFTCALGCAAGLEGFVGFCLGCFFFQIMISLGLVSPDVYGVYANTREEVAYTWEEMNKQLNEGVPPNHTKALDPEMPSHVDLHYKAKTDDMIREDFDVVKHVKIAHWMMHLSCVGLAVAWKAASEQSTMNAPNTVWHVLGIASAVLYVAWAALYVLRIVKYPGKVCKEWMCPLRGNGFALPLVCLPLFAYLIHPWTHKFAAVLFWAGAGPNMLLSLVRVGDWIALRHDVEHINPAWMIMPVGNFIAAFVGPQLNPNYLNTMQFFFAFAFMLWLLLFVVTFYKVVVHSENDDRNRPLLAVWIAPPAIGSVAYLSCFAGPAQVMAGERDFIFTNLYWFSVALFLIFVWCFVRPFFGRIKFDMGYWAAGFPAVAVATASMQYSVMTRGKLSMAISYTALAFASSVIGTMMINTLSGVLRRKIFVPDYKWGPVSFMKLTHEAIRNALTHMTSTLDKATKALSDGQADANAGQALLLSLANMWDDMEFVHQVHSYHEDNIIFPTFEEYFPGVASDAMDDHTKFHALSEQISSLLSTMLSSNTAVTVANVQQLDTLLRTAVKDLEAHLRHEEDHLQPVARRYLPLAVHKQVASKVWSQTPATTWFKMLPWVVTNLPMTQQRVRFIRAFLWAVPERAQQMGVMLAAGLDPTLWKVVTDELPELIPRGADGWKRYF